MIKNSRGFGFVELLVTAAVLLGIAYFIMKQMRSGPHSKSNAEIRKKLEAQGIAVPENTDLTHVEDVEKLMSAQLQETATLQAHKIGCTTGEDTSCAIPSSTPSSSSSASPDPIPSASP